MSRGHCYTILVEALHRSEPFLHVLVGPDASLAVAGAALVNVWTVDSRQALY